MYVCMQVCLISWHITYMSSYAMHVTIHTCACMCCMWFLSKYVFMYPHNCSMMIAREIGHPSRGITGDDTPGGGVGGGPGGAGTAGDRLAPPPGNTTAIGTRTRLRERGTGKRRERAQKSLQPAKGTVEHSYDKPEIPGQTVCYIRTISHEVYVL